MSCYRVSAGGWNKAHDQVERVPRIDSFEIGNKSRGSIVVSTSIERDVLDFQTFRRGGQEAVELWHKGHLLNDTLTIVRLQNGFGSTGQVFWVCPCCGKRRRFAYIWRGRLLCRSCAGLNYKRQQDTEDSMFWYDLGMEYAREHFAPPPCFVDGFAFCDWTPERPRYQHKTTYQKHLLRFRGYQSRHAQRLAADLALIMAR